MRITVIIPFFDAERFLMPAVDSVLRTNYPDLEIIMIDDGSTDGSGAIATTLKKMWPDVIQLLYHDDGKNHGMTASRNLGLSKSTGEAICFLDADDLVLPYRFYKSVPILAANPNIDGVYEAVGLIFESEKHRNDWHNRPLLWPSRYVHNCEDLLKEMLLNKMGTWQAAGILARKSLFTKTSLFTQTLKGVKEKVEDDTHLFYKMAAVGRLVPGELNMPVALYRRHGGNAWALNTVDDAYRDIFVIRHVLKWAEKNKDIISANNIEILRTGLKRHLIAYLKLLRKENRALSAGSFARILAGGIPLLLLDRLLLANLIYVILRR